MPDGESLLFTVVREFKGNADAADLVKLDLESGEVNAVRPFLPTYEFALAPDGARIAQPRRGGIAIIDIATGRERLVAQGLVRQASEIAWSTDGTWLAFNAYAMGTAAPRLWAWNLVSDELVPIDISRGEINGHVWVDRQRLLYCSDEGTALTLAADIAIRLMPPGPELKLGVVTALIGAPFFLHMVLTSGHRGTA